MRVEPAIPAEVLAAIRAPFQALAARPIDPPVLQPLAVILDVAGEVMRERLILAETGGGAEAALRPDFTIPAVRLHIEGGDGAGRYFYEGKAFAAAGHGPGDYEEFLQIGLEMFDATPSATADAEAAALAWRAAQAGGRDDLVLQFGDAGLFAAFIEAMDLAPPVASALARAFSNPRRLRALLEEDDARTETLSSDRLSDLIAGLPESEAVAVLENLWSLAGTPPVGGRSAAEIAHRLSVRRQMRSAPRLTPAQAERVRRYLAIEDSPAAALEQIARLGGARSSALEKALRGWKQRLAALEEKGAPMDRLRLSAAFGRDFGYYDGVLFEVRSAALGPDRPVAAGGRYDGLSVRLGARFAAVGCMVRPARAWTGTGQ